jgi:hypothetical protein
VSRQVIRRAAAAFLVLPLMTTCASSPPEPPAGMGRLVVKCCQLVGGTPEAPDCRPNPVLDHAAVFIDGQERGTCANWRGKGAIFATGRHMIAVRVPIDDALDEGQCCVDAVAYVKLYPGQILTQQVGLKAWQPPPGLKASE